METAGKLVDNEELRDALKENGIGRPSTRAAIIETLFKRHYIRKERKNLIATPTGVELIELIHEELLKSAELTGIWEKKLREIEKNKYDAKQFIDELKLMVAEIVNAVRSDNSNRHVAVTTEEDIKSKRKKKSEKKDEKAPQTAGKKSEAETPKTNNDANRVAGFQPRKKQELNIDSNRTDNDDEWIGLPCPICHTGHIIKGKKAYGCSRWKEGCTFRRPITDEADAKQ